MRCHQDPESWVEQQYFGISSAAVEEVVFSYSILEQLQDLTESVDIHRTNSEEVWPSMAPIASSRHHLWAYSGQQLPAALRP